MLKPFVYLTNVQLKSTISAMDNFNKKLGRSLISSPSSLILDVGKEKLFDDHIKSMNHKMVHCVASANDI